jgi:hypothetical protein
MGMVSRESCIDAPAQQKLVETLQPPLAVETRFELCVLWEVVWIQGRELFGAEDARQD